MAQAQAQAQTQAQAQVEVWVRTWDLGARLVLLSGDW